MTYPRLTISTLLILIPLPSEVLSTLKPHFQTIHYFPSLFDASHFGWITPDEELKKRTWEEVPKEVWESVEAVLCAGLPEQLRDRKKQTPKLRWSALLHFLDGLI